MHMFFDQSTRHNKLFSNRDKSKIYPHGVSEFSPIGPPVYSRTFKATLKVRSQNRRVKNKENAKLASGTILSALFFGPSAEPDYLLNQRCIDWEVQSLLL